MNEPQMPVKVDRNLEKVLKVFQEYGNVTTGFIVDETGLSRPTVTKRLDRLYAADCVEYLHEPTALWRLKRDPRDDNLNG